MIHHKGLTRVYIISGEKDLTNHFFVNKKITHY
jgi:hypothetical protein